MMTLGLHERTDVTHSSAQLVFRRMDTATGHPLPPGTSIVQAYDDAGQSGLLILGEPGGGKTTLLLKLARELLARAEAEVTSPIPVILNLSSWASKKLPLAAWVIDQTHLVYGVLRRDSQAWLANDHWLLLLDGLDEVDAAARSACIEAINVYHREHLAPLVVCSRSHEYLRQEERLCLPAAIEVQPLTPEQVESYLKQVGKPMAAVRTVLRTNPVLKQLLTTPLMFSVVILAYRDKAVKDIPKLGSAEEQQQQIFARYVERMLERRTNRDSFTPQQTRHWLGWLAQQMQQRHLTEFYLERMQPTSLPTKQAQIIYTLFVGLLFALFFALFYGLVGGLLDGPTYMLGGMLIGVPIGVLSFVFNFRLRVRLRYALVFGLAIGLFYGLVYGLLGALVDGLVVGTLVYGLVYGLVLGLGLGLTDGLSGGLERKSLEIRSTEVLAHSWKKFWQGLVVGLFLGLVVGLVFGLFEVLFGGLFGGLFNERFNELFGGLFGGLFNERFNELFGGLFNERFNAPPFGQVNKLSYDGLLGQVDKLSYDLLFGLFVGLFGLGTGLLGGLVLGIGGGLVSRLTGDLDKKRLEIHPVEVLAWSWKKSWQGLVVGLFLGLLDGLVYGLFNGLFYGLIFALAGTLIGGISGGQITEDLRIKANQGIRSSGWNALRVGLMLALLSGLAGGLLPHASLTSELVYGLLVGSLGGLYYGGAAYLEHYFLRFLLWRGGVMPWHAVSFLEEATERILLQRVGGGYRFIHPLFLDYFASQVTAEAKDAVQQPSSVHS